MTSGIHSNGSCNTIPRVGVVTTTSSMDYYAAMAAQQQAVAAAQAAAAAAAAGHHPAAAAACWMPSSVTMPKMSSAMPATPGSTQAAAAVYHCMNDQGSGNSSTHVPTNQQQGQNGAGLVMKVLYPSLPVSANAPTVASGPPQGPLPPPPPSAPGDPGDSDGTMMELMPSPRPASAGAAAYLALEASPIRHHPTTMHGSRHRLPDGNNHIHQGPPGGGGGPGGPGPGGGGGGLMYSRSTRHRGVNLRKQHSVSCANDCCDLRPNPFG